jgi:hypothetical protein
MARDFEFDATVIKTVVARQGNVCAYCGDPLLPYEKGEEPKWGVHHLVPNQSANPSDPTHNWVRTAENAIALCKEDHKLTHVGDPVENAKGQNWLVRYKDGPIPPAETFDYAFGKPADVGRQKAWAAEHARKAKLVWDDLQARTAANAKDLPGPNPKMVRNVRARALAKGAARAGASAAVAILVSAMRGKLERRMIERQIDELEPDIIRQLAMLKANRASVQSSGVTPFAVVTVETKRGTFHDHSGPSVTDTSLPVVGLKAMEIAPAKVAEQVLPTRTESIGAVQWDYIPLVWSFACPLTEQDVATHQRLTDTLNWGQHALSQDLAPQDRSRINDDLGKANSEYADWLQDN